MNLTPERTAQFEKLLAEDARLRNLVAQLVLDRHRLRHMPSEEAPDEIMDRVNQRLERRMLLDLAPGHKVADNAPARRFHIRRLMTYGSIAALVILGVGIIGYSLSNSQIHNLATDAERHQPGVLQAPTNNFSMGPMAQGDAAAGRNPVLAEFSRSAGPAMAATPPPALAAQSADFKSFNSTVFRTTARQTSHAMLPGLDADPDERLYLAPDSIANLIVEQITGVPARDPNIPTLYDFDIGKMSHMAKTMIPQVEQLMADNPELPSGAAQPQASDVGIFLQASDPDVSERAIRAWAIRNDLSIIDPGVDIDSKDIEGQLRDATIKIPAHAKRLVLLMERRQVGQLVSHLNMDSDQSARTAQLAVANASIGDTVRVAVPIYIANLSDK